MTEPNEPHQISPTPIVPGETELPVLPDGYGTTTYPGGGVIVWDPDRHIAAAIRDEADAQAAKHAIALFRRKQAKGQER